MLQLFGNFKHSFFFFYFYNIQLRTGSILYETRQWSKLSSKLPELFNNNISINFFPTLWWLYLSGLCLFFTVINLQSVEPGK